MVILPFSTILSNFSPYWTNHSFTDFLIASLVFAIVSLLLGAFITRANLFTHPAFLFFLLGICIAPPLMLGPPENTALLLERATEEKFRYGMLFVASLVFAAGFIVIVKKYWSQFSVVNKTILIPFAIAVVLLLWDNYSAFMMSNELAGWVKDGKKGNDFFVSYDYHESLRTTGRTLLYILIALLTIMLAGWAVVRKWVFIVLIIFCVIGVVFFFLFIFMGYQFYFPFMVPAIAMAPAYWLGISLLTGKQTNKKV